MSMRRPHPALALGTVLAVAGCGGADGTSNGTVDLAPESAAVAASASLRAPEAGVNDVFRNVLARSGIDYRHTVADGSLDTLIESVGSGVTVFDADGDGRLDLYFVDQGWREGVSDGDPVAGPGRNRLYRNLGDFRFEDVTDSAGVGDPGYGFMALAADFDDDGDDDLFVLNDGPNMLFRNRGDGTFEDARLDPAIAGDACSVAGALLDADADGLLDVYVGNYVEFDGSYRLHYAPDVFPGPLAFEPQADVLLVNSGGLVFRDGTASAGLDIAPARAMGASVLDANEDGRLDLFVANDATANFLFLAGEDGRFRECAARSGVAFGVQGEATAAMAGAVGDVDGDGRPDLHVTDSGYGSLFHNAGDGLFVDRVVASGIAARSGQWASWGGGFLDFDLDGVLDLYLANGDLHRATGRPDLLFRGRGDGRFDDASADSGAWFRAERMARGAATADLDDDGRIDIVICHLHDEPALLRGVAREDAHFVTLDLRARPGQATGFGARVVVTAGGRTRRVTAVPASGYLTQGDGRLHFGLGDAAVVERIEITWPDGETQTVTELAADRVVVVSQGGRVQ